MLAATGMRRLEVCGLRSESVDLERGVITVDWKVVSGPQRALPGRPQESESSIREITIDDYTIEVLHEWRGVKKRDRRAAKEVEPPTNRCGSTAAAPELAHLRTVPGDRVILNSPNTPTSPTTARCSQRSPTYAATACASRLTTSARATPVSVTCCA